MDTLPAEVLSVILEFCSARSLPRLALTNGQWGSRVAGAVTDPATLKGLDDPLPAPAVSGDIRQHPEHRHVWAAYNAMRQEALRNAREVMAAIVARMHPAHIVDLPKKVSTRSHVTPSRTFTSLPSRAPSHPPPASFTQMPFSNSRQLTRTDRARTRSIGMRSQVTTPTYAE